MIKIWIGIDPGVKTGLCVWDVAAKKIARIGSFTIHAAMDEVKYWHGAHEGEVRVRFEDARLRKWIPRQKTETAERGRREGAGSVKRDCKIWEDFLDDLKIEYEMVAPKNNKTKVTAEYFRMVSGHQGMTNEHSRDSGMLIIGK